MKFGFDSHSDLFTITEEILKVPVTDTAQKMKFSIKDFFSK